MPSALTHVTSKVPRPSGIGPMVATMEASTKHDLEGFRIAHDLQHDLERRGVQYEHSSVTQYGRCHQCRAAQQFARGVRDGIRQFGETGQMSIFANSTL